MAPMAEPVWSAAMPRPLPGFLLIPFLSATLSAAEPPIALPSLRSVHLVMQRGPEQESAELTCDLVTAFSDARLVTWEDARVERIDSDDGTPLIADQPPTGAPPLDGSAGVDDLLVPLHLTVRGFARPPLGLKTLRITATAVLATGTPRELALPLAAAGRSFAPQDDPAATVVVAVENGQWKLTLAEKLMQRTLRVLLRTADGDAVEGVPTIRERVAGRTVIDMATDNDLTEEAHVVVVLAEHIELRPVRLAADDLALFGPRRDPELLPLGREPAHTPTIDPAAGF